MERVGREVYEFLLKTEYKATAYVSDLGVLFPRVRSGGIGR